MKRILLGILPALFFILPAWGVDLYDFEDGDSNEFEWSGNNYINCIQLYETWGEKYDAYVEAATLVDELQQLVDDGRELSSFQQLMYSQGNSNLGVTLSNAIKAWDDIEECIFDNDIKDRETNDDIILLTKQKKYESAVNVYNSYRRRLIDKTKIDEERDNYIATYLPEEEPEPAYELNDAQKEVVDALSDRINNLSVNMRNRIRNKIALLTQGDLSEKKRAILVRMAEKIGGITILNQNQNAVQIDLEDTYEIDDSGLR